MSFTRRMIAPAPVPATLCAAELERRALGTYLGLAVGDALGATVEFMTAGEIRTQYGVHRQIVGGGWLHLKPGRVTDDTELCVALGRGLLASDHWDVRTVADSFVGWMCNRPADIGHTCRRGIRRYMLNGSLNAEPAADSAGNGAAMRNLPVALATLGDAKAFAVHSLAQAHLTHHHPLSDAATLVLGRITQQLVAGGSAAGARRLADQFVAQHPEFQFAPWPGQTSGYIVDTVQTVFDAFFSTHSFEECLVRAVNRGGDADTIGALAGQLAGACYGVTEIPARWLKRLDPAVHATIRQQTAGLLALAERNRQVVSPSPAECLRPVRPAYAQSPTVFNRCNVSPWVIGDQEFQDRPQPIEIAGVRHADWRLFRQLSTIADPELRGQVFHDYVSVKFRLHEWAEHQDAARSSIRSSYLQFLRNWGVDSNRFAGAVLKSWVESRFGLAPTYHGGRLDPGGETRTRYDYDCMRGSARTVGALMQLDLLYTFCQEELPRRFPGQPWRTLYRGTHDPEEYAVRGAEASASRVSLVRLNNLSSFTADRETAWEFGSSVWEVQVPLQKIVFFSGLLPRHLLEGESEYLVLGGDYRVRPLLY